MIRDVVYACRTLRRSGWYSATVAAVLAVGLALATVVFSVVDDVLFKPLPYAGASELVLIRALASTPQGPRLSPVSFRDVRGWGDAVSGLRTTVVSHRSDLFERLEGRAYWSAGIDGEFFEVLGVRPLLGGFGPEDFGARTDLGLSPSRWTPVLVSHRFWRGVLHEDPTVIGRNIVTSERQGQTFGYRVSGVLPQDFVFPVDAAEPQPDILRPISRLGPSGTRQFQVLARIVPGVDRVSVQERLLGATRQLAGEPLEGGHHPDQAADRVAFDDVRLVPLEEHLGSHERPAFGLVLAAATLLLLLACVNVAGLAAARNVERRQEMIVRRALGAGSIHLFRGMLAELGLFGAAGTVLAVVLSKPLLAWTVALLPAGTTLLKEPVLDSRVFSVVALLGFATVALVGLWPARVVVSAGTTLSGSADTVTPRVRHPGFVLVATQVALGFTLVAAGALTIASLAAAWHTDPGYRRDRMLIFEVFVKTYTGSADAVDQLNSARETVAAFPGVEQVAVSTIQPFFARRSAPYSRLIPRGLSAPHEGVALRQVSANYFGLMEIPLVAGRLPDRDEWEKETLAIVSESAARALWPGRSAIGQVLVPARRGRAGSDPDHVVIGIAADARYEALVSDPAGDIYTGGAIARGRTGVFLHVKTTAEAAAVRPVLARTLRERNLRLEQAATHEAALFESVKHLALPAWLFGFLSLAALVILGSGIFGLLAMAAARRVREIGVRLALGATPGRLVRMLIREQCAAVGAGLLAGMLFSAWAVRFVQAQLYNVRPDDLRIWLATGATLAAVAVIGTIVPSIQASRANPASVLRAE